MTLAICSDTTALIIYLHGTAMVPWDGTGTPWDLASTTPFALAMNDATGQKWTPTVAPKQTIWSGGPPLTNGKMPVYQSVDTVTETIPIQAKARTHADCLVLKQTLEQLLSNAFYSMPMMLQVDEFGSAAYYEIYSADVQEGWQFFNDENGRGVLRMTLQWTRSPFATPGSATTVINAATITNNGNDAKSMTVGGELKYLGQPLNVALSGNQLASTGVRNVWLASIYAINHYTPASAISTTSSTGVAVGATQTPNLTLAVGMKTRFMARAASPTANLQLRAVVTWGGSGDPCYTGAWVTGGSTSGAIYDLGFVDFPLSVRRAGNGGSLVQSMNLTIQARSTNGASATGTLTWFNALDYHTFAKITTGGTTAGTHTSYRFNDTGVGARLIHPPLYAIGGYNQSAAVAGQLPLAFSGSKLWAVWDSAGAHDNTTTVTCTAKYVPLYRTFIGAGVS